MSVSVAVAGRVYPVGPIVFHGKRHPAEMGAPEITPFLTSLAVDRKVAASTQSQALSALLLRRW